MLNRKPIFVVGFARGGTGLLTNILQSHPEVCRIRGELHQVFRGRWGKWGCDPLPLNLFRLLQYVPVVFAEQRDVFSSRHFYARRPFSPFTKAWVDRVLFKEKMRARAITQNRFKGPGQPYTKQEVRDSRLLCKNVNGLIALTPILQDMYPDASFVGLVRNGYAICEGQMRRGSQAAAAAKLYRQGCLQMIEDAGRYTNYTAVRFEDLLRSPLQTAKQVYEHCGLDFAQLTHLRFVVVPTMDADGKHVARRGTSDGELIWMAPEELDTYLEKGVNENQVRHLPDAERKRITEVAGDVLQHFGYA
jgi:hypothetical protein